MAEIDALKRVSAALLHIDSKTDAYFWKVSGNEANSLCRLLGLKEQQMNSVWHACGVRSLVTKRWSKHAFDLLMHYVDTDWTTFKGHRYIKIGKGSAFLPKDSYDSKGELHCVPIDDRHMCNMRNTRKSGGPLANVIDLVDDDASTITTTASMSPKKKSPTKSQDMCPKAVVYDYVCELLKDAVSTGKSALSQRSN